MNAFFRPTFVAHALHALDWRKSAPDRARPAGTGGLSGERRAAHGRRVPPRFLVGWVAAGVVLVGSCGGCTRQSEAPPAAEVSEPTENAASGDSNAMAEPINGTAASLPRVAPPVRAAVPVQAGDAGMATGAANASAGPAAPAAASVQDIASSGLQLPPGQSPPELKSFLATVDREIERLGSGRSEIQDREAIVAEIRRVAELKREAAERLLNNPEADDADRAIGTRARMQALSHKAALGDLTAAEALEQFAVELLNHPVDDIARDSRAVLIGFALERLQGGVTEKPDEVLSFVAELASRPELLDASSLMAMQRAMSVLRQYGYFEAAEQVRGQIATAFADLDNPQLSQLATDVLAAARFDELETMRRDIAAADGMSAEDWGAKAAEVAAQHPDMMTVQYLASLALQLESLAQDEEAAAVYRAMEQQLSDASSEEVAAAAQEAIRAAEARRSVVGQPLELPTATDLAGNPIAIEDFQGSVVLVPFWAVEEPGSIDALPGLEQFAAEYGERVRMLGVNMDVSPAGQNRAADLARRSMPWPSIAASDSGGTAYESQLAKQLGVVSLPTVVVLNAAGEVVTVALSHDAVASAVQELTGN